MCLKIDRSWLRSGWSLCVVVTCATCATLSYVHVSSVADFSTCCSQSPLVASARTADRESWTICPQISWWVPPRPLVSPPPLTPVSTLMAGRLPTPKIHSTPKNNSGKMTFKLIIQSINQSINRFWRSITKVENLYRHLSSTVILLSIINRSSISFSDDRLQKYNIEISNTTIYIYTGYVIDRDLWGWDHDPHPPLTDWPHAPADIHTTLSVGGWTLPAHGVRSVCTLRYS